MRCPSCEYTDSKVVDSRPSDDGLSIRRRRECLQCGFRFTTYERLNETPLVVIKSDKSTEPFDSEKLLRSLLVASAKRNIPVIDLRNLVSDVENDLRCNFKNEVRSKVIGEMVLERLRAIDDVAYIRFASVYRDFKSIEEFADALKGMN